MLGDFIRVQRQMANLSLRQLSALTEVSNPYLSAIRADRRLTAAQRRALLGVYRSYIEANTNES